MFLLAVSRDEIFEALERYVLTTWFLTGCCFVACFKSTDGVSDVWGLTRFGKPMECSSTLMADGRLRFSVILVFIFWFKIRRSRALQHVVLSSGHALFSYICESVFWMAANEPLFSLFFVQAAAILEASFFLNRAHVLTVESH